MPIVTGMTQEIATVQVVGGNLGLSPYAGDTKIERR
jgi:hypothetical protein